MVRFFYTYSRISYLTTKSNVANIGQILFNSSYSLLEVFVFLQVWQYVYSNHNPDKLIGFSLQQIIWYLIIGTVLRDSTPSLSGEIAIEAQSGNLTPQLLRPISYLIAKISGAFGNQVAIFLLTFIPCAVLGIIFTGSIAISWSGIIFFIICFSASCVINLIILSMIGLTVFWMEISGSTRMLYDVISAFLGGAMIPITILPDWIQRIVEFLPFYSIFYGPIKVLMVGSPELFISVLTKQIISLVFVGVCAFFLYKKALKTINLNGG